MRHISLLLAMKYIVYTVINRRLVVLINAKILILTYELYNSIFEEIMEYTIEHMQLFYKTELYDMFLEEFVWDYCVT